MNFKKGEMVAVVDFTGERFQRRVWQDQGARVAVTSEEIFAALEKGHTDLFPISIPKADVSPLKESSK